MAKNKHEKNESGAMERKEHNRKQGYAMRGARKSLRKEGYKC